MKDKLAARRWQSLIRVGLVLTIGCGASVAWWVNERHKIRLDAENELQTSGVQLAYDLQDRLNRIEHLLYGVRGLYTVNGRLERQAWETYWNSGDAASIPGLQGLSYLRRVERADQQSFVDEMRRELGAEFQLRPATATEDLVVIVLRRSFPTEPDFAGSDRSGSPAWRLNAGYTRRTGKTVLSGVVPSINDPNDSRLLLILPLYRPNVPAATEAERTAAHHGWVTAGIRPSDFFAATLSGLPPGVLLQLFDSTEASDQLLYQSGPPRKESSDELRVTLDRVLYGRHFRFRLTALPSLSALERNALADEVFLGGLLISALLGMLVWGSARTEQRARELVEQKTRELHQREWVLRQAQRIANVGTCIYDVTTKTFSCSDECCRILGTTPGAHGERALENFLAVVHPEDRPVARAGLERMQQGATATPHTLRILTRTRGERLVAIEHGLLEHPNDGITNVLAIVQDVTERVAADRALADSHRRMENLMRAIPGVIFQLLRTQEGQFSVPFVSEGATDLFGRTPQEFKGPADTLFRAVSEDGTGEFVRSLESSAETLSPWQHEARVTLPDGSYRWIRFNAVPLRDVGNNTVVWNGVAMDATQTKKAEHALRESEQRLRMTQFAVDHVKDAVAFISPQGDRIYVNDETCRLTGHSREELLQTKIWSTFASFTLENYCEMWAYVKNRGTHVFEATLRTRSGELRSVEVSVSFIGFGGQEMVFAIARDISARKAAELSLRDSEERLRFTQYALDHARDIVSIMDRDGNRLYVNDAFCQFTGYSRDELFRSLVWESIPSLNHERFHALWDDVRRCKTLSFEIELRTKSGENKPLEVNASYLNFSGREAVCTISRDLTARRAAEAEKKKMQQQLQETQKLESLGVLAGGIAHDFNNLLTGVLGNASLARDRLGENAELHEPLRQIECAAMRAAELCQQMLAYAGKGRFIVEPVNLSSLVEDTAKLLDLSVARRARLDLKLAPNLPPVLADATQLRQIVMNLVINAAEAIPHSRGVITVVTGRIRIDRKFLSSARVAADVPEGDGVFLEVSDTGSGMDRETLERIFEPFFTTKFTGRGLGLAAVLGIIRSHRGALQVESEPGRGTTFRLALAAHNQPAAPIAGTPPIFAPTKRNHGRILVVDDEESVRSVTRQALERTGFTVETAADGEAAIARLRTEPNAFRVILLDYTMPKLDGAQTLREIRVISPDAKVVLMSGFPEMEARERLGEHALAGFIQKPFDIGSLRKCVEDIVRGMS